MKFIVSSSQLFRQLQILGGVINSNNTLPILDNFLFELTDNQLRISASDLETTMSTSNFPKRGAKKKLMYPRI